MVFNPRNTQGFQTHYGMITPPQARHPQLVMQMVMQLVRLKIRMQINNQPTLPCTHQLINNNKTMNMYQTAQ